MPQDDPMRVAIWSDVVCPFCNVARERASWLRQAGVEVEWLPFDLHPEYPDEGIDRAALMAALEEDGIPSRPYFVPIHLQPYYRDRFGYQPGDFPVTERVAERTLAIPFYTEMPEEQVDYVCERIRIAVSGVSGE